MSRPVILCVDDERIILSSLKSQLMNNLGDTYQIELAESGEEALEILEELTESRTEVPLVIADQIMGGMYGDELLARIKTLLPNTHGIMLTGQATAESVGEAVNKASLFRYISKPWDEEDLVLTIKTGLRSYYDQKELRRQACYQSIIHKVLQLVITNVSFEEQLSQALSAILSTGCFSVSAKGSIYTVDLEQADLEWSTKDPDLVMISQVNQGEAPESNVSDGEVGQDVTLITSSPSVRYYRAPITLQGKSVGILYIYIDETHDETPQVKAFLSSVCHTLAGMIRISQYNRALEKHSLNLEQLVEKRTHELHQALRKQEQLNDIFLDVNKKLNYFATTDELTKLMNRRCFFERADAEASRARRYGRKALLAILDVDFFKEVNDKFGHQVGDTVLEKVAHVIVETIREHDVIGRIGGEEFALLMPETDVDEGKEICERVRLAISSNTVVVGDHCISISVSMGLSEVKDEESTISGAMIRADQALYDSKHKGRNLISYN
ncbi:GGDEF domain-containing response regulator [Alkalimarinus alittae]|uniref:diguanylate cyclase n=1 Tax=Alkalimarinus alittae TaxID=2961619 RepID=A0ABY6N1S1_9ALTE|nr:diguanylate cyclase [Alkalimarinus alittae]UZE96033.1 diguanylate cyclase [Alkalimarinus alittae]